MSCAASAAPVAAAGAVLPAATPAAAYKPPSHALSSGQSGAAVKSVQHRLNQLGYYAGPVDGHYGSDLQEAAWAFREVQGLKLNNTQSLEPITKTFLHDLISPRLPKVLVPHGGKNRIEINQSIEVLVLYRDNKPHLILHVSSGGRYYYCNQGSCGRDHPGRQLSRAVLPARRHQGAARLHVQPGVLHRARLRHPRRRPGALVRGFAWLRAHLRRRR